MTLLNTKFLLEHLLAWHRCWYTITLHYSQTQKHLFQNDGLMKKVSDDGTWKVICCLSQKALDSAWVLSELIEYQFLGMFFVANLHFSLAYAEVYMALAAVIRTFGDRLELFETTAEDVEIYHDVFVPVPKAGSKGIRVLVKQKWSVGANIPSSLTDLISFLCIESLWIKAMIKYIYLRSCLNLHTFRDLRTENEITWLKHPLNMKSLEISKITTS